MNDAHAFYATAEGRVYHVYPECPGARSRKVSRVYVILDDDHPRLCRQCIQRRDTKAVAS